MLERQKTSSSVYEIPSKKSRRDRILQTKRNITGKKLSIGIGFGILLTLITIILQFIAFLTPHWKEISPNTHSLYVDGVDALIRTEILHYFNTVHRSTRQSYGLFQRCEYLINNATKSTHQSPKQCTKNYLPSYNDEHFNECHSLPYYRFCTKASEKNFNINNDYLRATFDISYSSINPSPTVSCDCHYPPYVLVCHTIGIIALIFLILTCLLFIIFPFFTDPHYRLKIKCFGILASILAIIFLLTNLIIIMQHLEYESVEYLIAIERHYKLNQIYKLSQDTKISIEQFLSSIRIRLGYSAILAWIAFGLSIIDGILLVITCKIKHEYEETETRVNLIINNNEHSYSQKFQSIPTASQPPSHPTILPNSQNERSQTQFDDEV